MSLLIFALIVVIVVALLIWAADLIGLGNPPAQLIKALIVVIGIVAIASRLL